MSLSPDQPEDLANQQQPLAAPANNAVTPAESAPFAGAGAPSAPQPAWARPAVETQWVETEPLEYHQLLRGVARPRWWKPVLGLILGVLYYFTLSTAFSLVIFGIAGVFEGRALDIDSMLSLAIPDTQRPLSMVMTLGSLALMIPSALLAMLSVGLTPAGRLWSVALRIRWRLVRRAILPAIMALFVMNAVGIGLDMLLTTATSSPPAAQEPVGFDVSAALWSVLIILLLVPLQSASEELVFRGAFMQAIGAWRNRVWFVVLVSIAVPVIALTLYLTGGLTGLADQGVHVLIVTAVVFGGAALLKWRTGSPLIAVALPSVVFAFAHIYEIWGMLSVATLAIVAAWLTWRTGGLEAAITLHVVNNLVGFLMMAAAYGGETKQTAEGSTAVTLLAAVLGQVFFAWWVDRDFRRTDGRRTRIDRVQRMVSMPQAQPNGGVTA